LGAKDYQPQAPDFHIELGYLYRSPAILVEGGLDREHEDPNESFGRPGSRAPHVWLERGRQRISTIDLFGRSFVLLAARDAADWVEAARDVAGEFHGLELDTHIIGREDIVDRDGHFAGAYGLTSIGAALVRPDGFVAWRTKSAGRDPRGILSGVLRALLMKA